MTGCFASRPLLAVVVLLMPLCGCEPDPPPGPDPRVVATVGNRPVTVAELRTTLGASRIDRSRSAPDHRRLVLQRIIELHLAEEIASERGLATDPRYLERARSIELDAAHRKRDILRALLREDLAKDYDPPDEATRAYYEEHLEAFQTMRFSLREIVTETASEAASVLDDLKAGEPFENVARRRSVSPSASLGGSIGPFDRRFLPAALAPHVLRMQTAGEIAGPFETPAGWTVLRLESRNLRPSPLARVRDRIEATLRRQETARRYEALLDEKRRALEIVIDDTLLADSTLFTTPRPP